MCLTEWVDGGIARPDRTAMQHTALSSYVCFATSYGREDGQRRRLTCLSTVRADLERSHSPGVRSTTSGDVSADEGTGMDQNGRVRHTRLRLLGSTGIVASLAMLALVGCTGTVASVETPTGLRAWVREELVSAA